MASSDDVLMRGMSGFRKEVGQPLKVPVEPGQYDSSVSDRYNEIREESVRPEYRGFTIPSDMERDESDRWFAAIDVREDARERKEAEPYLTRKPEPWEGQFLEQMKSLSLAASQEEQRFLRDPEARGEAYKEFAGEVYEDVMAGDPETIRNVADVSSLVDITGTSDVTSAVQSGRLAYREPDRRGSHLTDVAISGVAGGIQLAATALGAAPLVGNLLSGARLKAAMKADSASLSKAEEAIATKDPVFESVLEKAVVENMPNKLGVDDVEQFLNKKGAKKSEIVDTKVPEFVASSKAAGKKSVTKDELIQHLDDNKVQIDEVRLAIQGIPDDIKALSEQSTEAFNDLYDDSLSLAAVLAPRSIVSEHMHRFSDNPAHFTKLYVDYVGGINRIKRFNHDVPDDVFDITSRLINLGRDRSINMWRPEDAALITEARNTINAKLADPEYVKSINEKNFWVGPENEAMRTMDEFEFQRITDEAIEARAHHSNLTTIARILNEMPEAETRLAALRKFQELPNYKKYAALTYDYNEKYRVFQSEVRQLPQWGNYTVPGGEDYQEILLTVPQKVTQDFRSWHKSMLDRTMGGPQTGTGPDAFSYDSLPKDMQKADRATYRSETDKEAFLHPDFTESHFRDIPNVMAHIRFKTRIDSKGRKILFVEEIQSDWHQKGLKRGYEGQKINIPDDVESAIQKMESTKKSVDDWKAANPKPPNYSRGFQVRQESGLDVFGFMIPEKVGAWKKTLSKEDLDAYDSMGSWQKKAYGDEGPDGELYQLIDAYHDAVKGVEVAADGIGLRLHARGDTIRRSSGGMPQSVVPIESLRDNVAEHIASTRTGWPVPDAPLKNTKEWAALAIKRIFREAADGGYDGVAFSRADMITPVVTLPGNEAAGLIGNPEAFMARLAELKQQGGHYAEGAEEAEKVFKGNQYFYDKLIPSIVKKETKAKQGTTLVELEDVGFSSIRDPEYPGHTAEFFDAPEAKNTLKGLVKDGRIIEVPFFELTKEVKNKVIKPQKLYSVALPGIAVGAAAAEEEELSAAAALGAIGMGGMALYKGAKAARVADLKVPTETSAYEGQQTVGKVVFDSKDGMGAVSNSKNVAYKGFVVWMKPQDFLGLNPVRSSESAADTVKAVTEAIEEGKSIGPPFLNVKLVKDGDDAGSFQVVQHEGRGRMAAINSIQPDVPVPVHVFGRGAIDRGRDLTPEMMQGLVDPTSNVRLLPDKKATDGKAVTPDAAWHVPDSDDYDPNYLPVGKTYRADVAKPPASAPTKLPETQQEIDAAFKELGRLQNDRPETAMYDMQRSKVSPLWSQTAEHVGDIIRRMTPSGPGEMYRPPEMDIIPKTRRGIADLSGDIEGGIRSQAGTEAKLNELRALGQKYADEHRKLPVYNELQMLANDAAIALGEGRFADSKAALVKLDKIYTENPDKFSDRLQVVEPEFARPGLTAATPAAPDVATAGSKTADEAEEAARLWREMGTESPYFKKKFGNTKVLDDDGEALPVFHGTSGDFDEFRAGSTESAFGSAIYTSSSVDDVNANYARAEGPDISRRVSSETGRIDSLDDFDDDDILDAAQRYMDRTESTDTELLEAIKTGNVEKLKDEFEPDLIEQIARQIVLGDENFSVMKTYVNIENPVYLDPSGTKGRTTFDLEYKYDEDGDIIDKSGSVIDLLEAIDDVSYDFYGSSDEVQKLKTFIGENSVDGELDALDLFEEVRGGEYYFHSDTGGLENSEFIRQVFEKMGFDGIIADAYHFFGDRKGIMGIRIPSMAGVTPGSYHYMAFKPEQIKSATGNVGTFDPSGNILKGIGVGAAVPAAAAVRSQRQEEQGNPLSEPPEYESMSYEGGYSQAIDFSETAALVEKMIGLSNEAQDLYTQMGLIEAEYGSLTEEDKIGKRGKLLAEWYDDSIDKFSEAGRQLNESEYDRYLMGSDTYYDTDPKGIQGYDDVRLFVNTGYSGDPMLLDADLRASQENKQRKRLKETIGNDGPMLDMFGKSGDLNRYLYQKAKFFEHPVQTVQLNNDQKRILAKDYYNLEALKETGLISYLLYKELLGNVELV